MVGQNPLPMLSHLFSGLILQYVMLAKWQQIASDMSGLIRQCVTLAKRWQIGSDMSGESLEKNLKKLAFRESHSKFVECMIAMKVISGVSMVFIHMSECVSGAYFTKCKLLLLLRWVLLALPFFQEIIRDNKRCF